MWLRFYQALMVAFFIASVFILAATGALVPPLIRQIPEPVTQPKRLTNQEFYASEQQRALIRRLNGTLVLRGGGRVDVESPASPEETLQLCRELDFGLPLKVTCEAKRIGFEAATFEGGRLLLNHWYRTRDGKRQEFLEMGLLSAEGAEDFGVPLGGSHVKLGAPVEGQDHH